MDQKQIEHLPNEILMRIFEYLNFDDFKDASSVCHQWYDLLHKNRFLPSLSIVKVPKLYKDEDIEFLSNTNNFHNFENWSIEDYELLLLNEKCQLHQRDSIKFLDIDYGGEIKVNDLIEILLKFKNLEELKLEIVDITTDNTFKRRKITHNLKSFSISHCTIFEKLDLIGYLDLFSIIENLKIKYIPIEQKHIDFIISKYGRTLKELHLAPDYSEHIIELSNLNLKKLRCNLQVLQSSNFEEFIKTQKDLVRLDLIYGDVVCYEFIAEIFENLKNLKELKVQCKNDSLFKIMKLKNLKKLCANWIITRDMRELYQGVWDDGNNVLYSLGVSCINEAKFKFLSSFFEENFPNLRALDLSRCSKVVTNSLLQLIFKNCTNLLHLNLSNCKKVSDKGITGKNFNEDGCREGVSIANLKGLRSLDLSSCNITDFSLEFGLRFLELREINLSWCEHITRNGLEHLAQNCPSLAKVRECDGLTSAKLSRIFKRIKQRS